jgi:TRAP-type mannitol/chloroaromatic compound transport system permease small subunit
MLLKLENIINTFSDWLGKLAALLLILLLLNVFIDVVMRYMFNSDVYARNFLQLASQRPCSG